MRGVLNLPIIPQYGKHVRFETSNDIDELVVGILRKKGKRVSFPQAYCGMAASLLVPRPIIRFHTQLNLGYYV